MTLPRILHIAPANVANVPFAMMQGERALGFDSRLVTLCRSGFGFPEDICLDLPFMRSSGLARVKRAVSDPARLEIDHVHRIPETIPLQWRPHGLLEKSLIRFRELTWRTRISRLVETLDLMSFDVIQLDGGLEFYRDGRIVTNLKRQGKKIICCYTGSDLRTRGVIPQIDAISDLNVTVEYDHLLFHPDIHHVFFPFAGDAMPRSEVTESDHIRIGHAPTNRAAKGTERILSLLRRLSREYPIEVVLIENKPYEEALALKSRCDLFIDQIGDLGYGVNALEALAMGIPVATSLASGFDQAYPDHPFITISGETMAEELAPFLGDAARRRDLAASGRAWLERHHDPVAVVRRIHRLAGIAETTGAQERGE